MDTATRAQILDEAVWISNSINTLEKGINPTMSKIVGQTGLFSLSMATNLGERKSVKLHLNN